MLRFRNFPEAKNFIDKTGGSIKIFRRNFCCIKVPNNFAGEPVFAVLQKGLVAKILTKRRGGISRFSLEIFLSHSAEKSRRGESLVFHSFRVWKVLDKRGRGHQDFPPIF